MPLYLNMVGLEAQSASIPSILSVMMVPSIFLFNYIALKIPDEKNYMNLILRTLRFVAAFLFFFVPKTGENTIIFFILIGAQGFTIGWPMTFTVSTEMRQRVTHNREIYLALVLSKVVAQVFSILEMLACGYLLKTSSTSFI